jgi:hypothetical protein
MASKTTKKMARTCGYSLHRTYSPVHVGFEYHVSSPAGYGTHFKSRSLAAARRWIARHCKKKARR